MFAVGINLRPEAFKKVFMSPKVVARPWPPIFMLIPFTFAALLKRPSTDQNL